MRTRPANARSFLAVSAALTIGCGSPIALAASFNPGQDPGEIAKAIAEAGGCSGTADRYAAELLAANIAPGEVAESLLLAECGTEATVRALLTVGGNAVAMDVVTRVLYLQGDAVIDLVRTTAYAVRGIDKQAVDLAIAMYMGNRHKPIRDPGVTPRADTPESSISDF